MDDTEDVIRYADPLDAASALTDSINRRALRIARNSNRCVACQTEYERYERQYGRKRP